MIFVSIFKCRDQKISAGSIYNSGTMSYRTLLRDSDIHQISTYERKWITHYTPESGGPRGVLMDFPHHHTKPPSDTGVLVNTALLARIEALEAENSRLKKDLDKVKNKRKYFRLEQVKHDDNLIRFYTGFVSYAVFLSFFNFLGPVVYELHYRGGKGGQGLR